MAHKLLQEASVALVEAERITNLFEGYLKAREPLAEPPPDPLFDDERETMKKALEQADAKAESREFAAAHELLRPATLLGEVVKAKAAAKDEYHVTRELILKESDGLAKARNLNEELDAAKKHLSLAETKAKDCSLAALKEATQELLKARSAFKVAKAKNEMLNLKKAGAIGDLNSMVSTPEGTAALDKIVASLPEDTPIKVYEMALKARFQLNSVTVIKDAIKGGDDVEEDSTKPDLSLREIYKLMTKVPESHTKGNESLLKMKRYLGDAFAKETKAGSMPSKYSSTEKEVVYSNMPTVKRGETPHPKVIADENEVPKEARQYLETGGEAPTYFSWTTLHEVAHAVDDKKGFMKKETGNPDFGGWIHHGFDPLPAAQAAAKRFDYDVTYIVRLLSGESANPVPLLARQKNRNRTQEDWDKCRKEAEVWAANVRVGKKPWNTTAQAEAITLDEGTRVYQETAGGYWVSYLLSARQYGVTGYQFRAPGEWFSELYAAYGCRKLKSGHPAFKWLQKLFKGPPK